MWHLKVNHTAKNVTEPVHNRLMPEKIGFEIYLIMIAMVIFTILEFGFNSSKLPFEILLGISVLNYFLIVFLYYGIATLAYQHRTWLLWGSGAAIYIVAYMFTGLSSIWAVLSEWSMILFGGAVIGRLTYKNIEHQKVYIFGMLAVTMFALFMFAPFWSIIIDEFTTYGAEMIESAKQTLPLIGYSAEEIATHAFRFEAAFAFIARIIPALLLFSAVMQFSIGYLFFVHILKRKNESIRPVAPFNMWKMPYYVTAVILIAAVMRFIGNESIILVGDNILTFLALFYAITGLSLMEYYIKKIKLHPFVRICFYVLLFLTQHIGFFAAVFLGFIDSFKDFRNKEKLSLQNE